jgi:hypothetical protein
MSEITITAKEIAQHYKAETITALTARIVALETI